MSSGEEEEVGDDVSVDERRADARVNRMVDSVETIWEAKHARDD